MTAKTIDTADVAVRLTSLLTAFWDSTCREGDLKNIERRALQELEGQPVIVGVLQVRLGIKLPATLSRVLKSLERKGAVSRQLDDSDLRRHLIAITAKGRGILGSHRLSKAIALREVLDDMSQPSLEKLADALDDLTFIKVRGTHRQPNTP